MSKPESTDISHASGFVRANRRRLLGEDLARNAINFPQRLALHDVRSGWRLSYGQFEARVNWVAHALLARGIRYGDRVCMLGRNHLDTLTLYYAGSRIGAILVPMNPNASTNELNHIVADAAPKAAAISTELEHGLDRSVTAGLDVFTYGTGPQAGDLASWVREGRCEPPDLDIDDRAPVLILYTGGTTGKPKGVMLSQAGYVAMADNTLLLLAPQGFGRSESWLVAGPLYHGAAIAYAVTALHFGQVVHLLPEFNAEDVLAAIARGYGTATWFIPTMSRRIVDLATERRVDPAALAGLRLIISAGAPLSLTLRQELHRTFHKCQVIDLVGQTELTSTVLAHSEPDLIARDPSAVGLPAPGIGVALLDERDEMVAVGATGELCYRGESLMLGYWNKPEQTREVMAGGWFHSGDLARRNSDGLIHIVGRKKELIKSGGENIIPNEIEDVLRTVPGVLDACVIGVRDDHWGERVHAVVAVGRSAIDIERVRASAEAACRTNLSRYKVPKTWSVLAVLPTTAVGKCDKAKIRELVADGNQPLDLRGMAATGPE